MSDCGRFGVTVIAFVGSVFSPWYHWSGRREPENHVAINVALYSVHANRWAMTERGRASLARTAESFTVGPSSLRWIGGDLVIRFDEIAIPRPPSQFIPRRMRGQIRLAPGVSNSRVFSLHHNGRHHWQPVAPLARIAVEIEGRDGPGWEGEGYFDANWGSEPLEAGFRHWDWSRGSMGDSATILYDATRADGSEQLLGLRFSAGGIDEFAPPPRQRIARGFWGVEMFTRCDEGAKPHLVRALEDGPFYTRSLVETTIAGERIRMMHESYSGRRYSSPLVKLMLPVRMPRRA
jgi:carotenoid 1,2-hydratase